MTKQENKRNNSPTEFRPIHDSSKKMKCMITKKTEKKTKFEVRDLIITENIKKTISKGGTTKWSHKFSTKAS